MEHKTGMQEHSIDAPVNVHLLIMCTGESYLRRIQTLKNDAAKQRTCQSMRADINLEKV